MWKCYRLALYGKRNWERLPGEDIVFMKNSKAWTWAGQGRAS